MKIKRLLGGLAVLGFGATLLGAGAYAAGLADFVATPTDHTLSSPIIVIGSNAGNAVEYPKDVVGAADIAAAMAGYATTTQNIPTTAGVTTVTGGASLATSSTNLNINDSINNAVNVLTKDDISDVLDTRTFEDEDGEEYDYEEFLYIGSKQVTFGNNGESQDPVLYIDMGTDASDYLYSVKIVFDQSVNFSTSEVKGEEIVLLGTSYSISEDATNSEIVLYGAALKETIDVGQTKTITFEEESYEIELIGLGTTSGMLKVEGVTKEVSEDHEYTVSGLTFYVEDIGRWDLPGGEGYSGYVKLSIGSQKIIFEHDAEVAVGEDEEGIDGTLVALSGTNEISVIEIKVAASDSDLADLKAGETFTDPVFGTFKVAFDGMTPKLDSAAREEIVFGLAGDDRTTVKLTTSKGDTKTVEFSYYDGSSHDLELNKKTIVAVEGSAIEENQYAVINAGGFSHLMQVTGIDPAGGSAGDVTLKDVFSGTTYEITLPVGDNDVQKVIDGQTYYINVTDASTPNVKITWSSYDGDVPGYATPGAYQTVFPTLETSKGALVAFAANVTGINATGAVTNVVLPGGEACTTDCTKAGVSYDISLAVGGKFVKLLTGTGDPTVIIAEEEDINDAMNSVVVYAGLNTDDEAILGEPVVSANVGGFVALETDDDLQQTIDLYGTLVTYDSTDDNLVKVSYPDDQATVTVGIGSNPKFSTSAGGGGTYEEAVPIMNPVAKLDSQVSASSSLTADLILVGGPCANTLVKQLLDTEWSVTNSCSEWGTKIGTASGTGLLTTITNAFGSGHKALIVAGTNADDTRTLCDSYVIKGDLGPIQGTIG